jgi:hypothetical protein
MIITCDSDCSMGYIYLKPKKRSEILEGNTIEGLKTIIPLLDGTEIQKSIEKIPLITKTYYEAKIDGDFIEEYYNDLDQDGYMIGVELTLYKKDFINKIKAQVFKIFVIEKEDKIYNFITLDDLEKVLNPSNSMYPLTKEKDCFVIVEKKEKTGYIKALISSRDDIYPLKYLITPKFIISD